MKPPRFHRMYGYDLNLLPNAHLRTLEAGVTTLEQAREKSRWSIGYPGWGLLYHLLLCHLDRDREEVLLETGSNEGCSTIILAQALADAGCKGKVHSVELDETFASRARNNLEAAGLSTYSQIHQGDTGQVLPALLKKIAPPEHKLRFALLDASHLFNDVMREFEAVLPHLSDDALVVFDNTYEIAEPGEDSRVNGALKVIVQRYGGNLINLEFVSWFTPGLAIWQRKPNL